MNFVPSNPNTYFATRPDSPLPQIKTVFRSFQSEALCGLVQCDDKKKALALGRMIDEVAKTLKKTCEELVDHPSVEKEELESFSSGAERILAIYRGRLAALLLGNQKLETACIYIEKHKSEIKGGKAILETSISGLSYPILVDGKKISIETEAGLIAYPEVSGAA